MRFESPAEEMVFCPEVYFGRLWRVYRKIREAEIAGRVSEKARALCTLTADTNGEVTG